MLLLRLGRIGLTDGLRSVYGLLLRESWRRSVAQNAADFGARLETSPIEPRGWYVARELLRT
jgi:hypothetical protein